MRIQIFGVVPMRWSCGETDGEEIETEETMETRAILSGATPFTAPDVDPSMAP